MSFLNTQTSLICLELITVLKKGHCEHRRRRNRCKECGGSGLCKHDRIKEFCKECGGSQICEHDRIKYDCKECGGSRFCKHGRRKDFCKECGGSRICKHKKQKIICFTCSKNPILYCDFTLCGYQTKDKQRFKRHQKTHSEEHLRKMKKEEYKIEKLLLDNNIHFKREHYVSYSCDNDIDNSSSRIDFVIEHTDCNGTFGIICLEVDENQHEDRMLSCEVSRMSKIVEILTIQGNTLPIRFIRYNPHAFKQDNKTHRTTQNQRHDILLNTIYTITFTSQLSVKYLFYTTYNTIPIILNDPEYNENFKQFVEL